MYKKLIILLATIINVIYGDVVPIKSNRGPIPVRDIPNNGRIIHGTNAATGQFPWQVAIQARIPGYVSFCGGSLITSNAVLTAGHCCKDYDTFQLNFGSIYADAQTITRTVDSSKVVYHPKYDASTMNYDAAIIRLDVDVPFTANIQPIGLPRLSEAVEDLFSDVTLTISGWGRTESGDSATQLQYADMKVIKNSECKKYADSTLVIESTLCAKDTISSPCNGDSGGPAILNQNDTSTLIGIISFTSGISCQTSFFSGLVNVSFLLNWISSTTGIPIAYFEK